MVTREKVANKDKVKLEETPAIETGEKVMDRVARWMGEVFGRILLP